MSENQVFEISEEHSGRKERAGSQGPAPKSFTSN